MWKKAVLFCPETYKLTHKFPDFEKFGLSSQLQRASVSISANIAEGQARGTVPDFVRFLYMSLGSVQEVETLLLVSKELGYVDDIGPWESTAQEITRMLVKLITSLRTE